MIRNERLLWKSEDDRWFLYLEQDSFTPEGYFSLTDDVNHSVHYPNIIVTDSLAICEVLGVKCTYDNTGFYLEYSDHGQYIDVDVPMKISRDLFLNALQKGDVMYG